MHANDCGDGRVLNVELSQNGNQSRMRLLPHKINARINASTCKKLTHRTEKKLLKSKHENLHSFIHDVLSAESYPAVFRMLCFKCRYGNFNYIRFQGPALLNANSLKLKCHRK